MKKYNITIHADGGPIELTITASSKADAKRKAIKRVPKGSENYDLVFNR